MKFSEPNFWEITVYSSQKFQQNVEAFLVEVLSKMHQESISSRNQVDIEVNCKNKILQSFLEPIELHKQILRISLVFESWIAKLIKKKQQTTTNNFFP